MKFKGTIGLFAVFAGLILYYYLVDAPAIKKAQEEKELSEKVLPFDGNDVEEVALAKADGKIKLQRAGKFEWNLVEPLAAKGDPSSVEALLGSLANIRFTRVVEEAPANLDPYGLTEPALKISLLFKDKNEKALLVGDKSPIGFGTYVKLNNQKKVLLASLGLRSLDKSLFDLRDKTILDYNTREVTGFELKRRDETLLFSKKENQWSFSGTVSAKADADSVESFLNSVRLGRVRAFVEESPTDLTAFGLDKPSIILTVTSGEDSPTKTLRIGAKGPDEKYYAQRNDAKNVFAVNMVLYNRLTQNYVDFLDKTLVEFEEEAATEIRIRNGNENILIVRDPGDRQRWKIETPELGLADAATVNSLLLDLKEARVKEFFNFSKDQLKLFGLDKPRKELTVIFGKEKSATIKLGNSNSDKTQYFATRSGDSLIIALEADTVNKIFRSFDELKNRKLLNFKMDEVKRIVLNYPDKNFELQRDGENWDLLQPEKIKGIKPFIGKDILWTLNNLEYEEVADLPAQQEAPGFDKPTADIALYDSKNEQLGRVRVGNPTGQDSRRYAKVEGHPDLYMIKERFLDELPKTLEKFKR